MAKGKVIGFYASRKLSLRRRLSSSRWLWFLALLVLVWILGATQLWSQSSEPRLSGLGVTLESWDNISLRFQEELTALRKDLTEGSKALEAALKDAAQSKTSSEKWMYLYEDSLLRLTNLENYSLEIGQRMQERDEDLVRSYDEIDRLKELLRKRAIAIMVMVAVLGFLIFILVKRR